MAGVANLATHSVYSCRWWYQSSCKAAFRERTSMRIALFEAGKIFTMAETDRTEPELSKVADTVLKISALVGVAAAIASFGYNFAQCAEDYLDVALSIPTFLLAMFVFGIALGLTDETFGNFRDMDFSAGSFFSKATKLFLYLLGYLMEVSLFAVAFYSFRAAGNLPNCLP